MKNLKKLYSMAVCFISALVLLYFVGVSTFYMVELTLTQYKYKSYLTKFSSIEKFISSKHEKEKARLRSLNKEEVIEKMKLERASYLQEKKDKAIENIVGPIGIIMVTTMSWLIHWKMYQLNDSADH